MERKFKIKMKIKMKMEMKEEKVTCHMLRHS